MSVETLLSLAFFLLPFLVVGIALPPATEIPTGKCHPDPNNQRKAYQLEVLKTSIAREGILQAIGVWFDAAKNCFFVMLGNSRLLCARDLGLPTVPARVWDRVLSRLEIAKFQAAENLARAELRPSERAATFRELMDLENLTAKEVAEQWGTSPATVSRYLSILDHPQDIVALVDDGTLCLSASAALARLADEETRREMIRQIRQGNLGRDRIEEEVQARIGKRSKPRGNRLAYKLGEVGVSLSGGTLEAWAEALQALLRKVKKAAEQGMAPEALAKALRNGGA